jgi:hypothetical protein
MSEIQHQPGPSPLYNFSQRLQDDPDYMAWVLEKYRSQERLSLDQLLSHLGITLTAFTRLTLCKRPHTNPEVFADQVRQVAEYAAVDPSQLANILRQVDSLEALSRVALESDAQDITSTQRSNASWHGVFAAARDHDDEEE